MLSFDESLHKYTWHGNTVPSVTQILNVLGCYEGVPVDALAIASARGTAVHKATELYDMGVLDWATVDDEVLGYLEGYIKFIDDYKPEIISIEERMYHDKLGYAGTPDRFYVIKGSLACVDLKSSFKLMPATAPQTAAYVELKNQGLKSTDKIKKRYGLRLSKDGNYELKEYKSPTDFSLFISCLNVVRWKQEHNKNFDFLT